MTGIHNFRDPLVVIESLEEIEINGRPVASGFTQAFHLWKQHSTDEAVEVSSKSPQVGSNVQEVLRRLPTTFRCTIRCSDGVYSHPGREVFDRDGNFLYQDYHTDGLVVVPTVGNVKHQDDSKLSQIERLRALLEKKVQVTTRTGVVTGIVSRVTVQDDGQWENSVPVDLEVQEIRRSDDGRVAFASFDQIGLEDPELARYNARLDFLRQSDSAVTRTSMPTEVTETLEQEIQRRFPAAREGAVNALASNAPIGIGVHFMNHGTRWPVLYTGPNMSQVKQGSRTVWDEGTGLFVMDYGKYSSDRDQVTLLDVLVNKSSEFMQHFLKATGGVV